MANIPGGRIPHGSSDFATAKWVVLFTTEQGESAAAGPFDASNAIFVADRCNGKAVRLRTAEASLKG